jgi:hypothetical protein
LASTGPSDERGAQRWRSRSEIERRGELEAEAFGVPYDEVLKRLEEESRRSGGDIAYGLQEELAF